jgi:hypothetical protein
MAGNAMFVENGFDIGTKIHLFFCAEKDEPDEGKPNQDRKK